MDHLTERAVTLGRLKDKMREMEVLFEETLAVLGGLTDE